MALALHDAADFWRGYLVGFIAWWLVTVGAMGLFCLGHLTGGSWMKATRPFLLAAMTNAPLVALTFVPLALNIDLIYPWAPPTSAVRESFSPTKAAYLSPQWFVVRSGGYLLVWCAVGLMFRAAAFRRARPADSPGVRRAAAIALVLLMATVTFAAFDWGMSLEPEWVSSIYGARLAMEGVLAAHAIAVLCFARVVAEQPLTARRSSRESSPTRASCRRPRTRLLPLRRTPRRARCKRCTTWAA